MSKPYGPIRRWLGKIGLLSSPSSEEQTPTAELPKLDFALEPEPDPEPEPELLTRQELESSTADTRPLPPEMAVSQFTTESKTDDEEMEIKDTQTGNTASEINERGSGPLLDLGDFQPAHAAAEEDFVLDIDFDEAPEPSSIASSFPAHAVSGLRSSADDDGLELEREFEMVEVVESDVNSVQTAVAEPPEPTADQMAETQEMLRPVIATPSRVEPERAFTEPEIVEHGTLSMGTADAEARQITLEQLSPEAIETIARRAVEMLSARVVQEIAWEVVPQLAELMIKRQLEEKNS